MVSTEYRGWRIKKTAGVGIGLGAKIESFCDNDQELIWPRIASGLIEEDYEILPRVDL